MTGFFLTFEGVDGAGKSTQARRLAARLRRAGHEVVLTREPGGAPGAEEIRRLLLTGDPARWSPVTETLLFFAARRDHLERTILPALARGATVISDRFTDSTRAYQAAARPDAAGAARALIDLLQERTIGLDPRLTLIIDMDPAAAHARGVARTTDEARFERLGAGFQTRLRQTFHEIAAAEPERCKLIDAAGDEDAVASRVWAVVEKALR
ncbi:dTMP kinase [Pikeienuella piscinae]|uniref:Thymidylate kinase n=1 Tax=Pikeienuella piscinae TaxID=2748098 RepID=A0A7L5BSX1_9RHOB|nr:dTMP kinase [Pikeienuella piscinae]QIE54172.1 dTMP kinase [Pikeienuella piscinae]